MGGAENYTDGEKRMLNHCKGRSLWPEEPTFLLHIQVSTNLLHDDWENAIFTWVRGEKAEKTETKEAKNADPRLGRIPGSCYNLSLAGADTPRNWLSQPSWPGRGGKKRHKGNIAGL